MQTTRTRAVHAVVAAVGHASRSEGDDKPQGHTAWHASAGSDGVALNDGDVRRMLALVLPVLETIRTWKDRYVDISPHVSWASSSVYPTSRWRSTSPISCWKAGPRQIPNRSPERLWRELVPGFSHTSSSELAAYFGKHAAKSSRSWKTVLTRSTASATLAGTRSTSRQHRMTPSPLWAGEGVPNKTWLSAKCEPRQGQGRAEGQNAYGTMLIIDQSVGQSVSQSARC